MSRKVLQQTYTLSEANVKDLIGWLRAGQINRALIALEHLNPAEPAQPVQPEQEPVLQDIEQYRMQMAGISTAALGYWKDGDGIHPDYDTVELRDVAKLYAKYDALYKARWAAQPEQEPMHPKIEKLYEDFFDKCFRESPTERQPLTLAEIDDIIKQHTGGFIGGMHFVHLARAIEAKHGIGDKT